MGDSESSAKKAEAPPWQQKLKETTPTEGDESTQLPSRETIIEQAKKFLEEDEVRNASTDRKIAFLEGKGLQADEIESLLGVTRNPEASAPSSSTPPQPSQTTVPPTQTYNPPQPQIHSTPPIITYPEFLTTPTSPTPLVTTPRLLTTLSLFSGLSFLLYGTHTYLLTPMLYSLTTSRLSLASTASNNLQTLIRKLEDVVSEIPSSSAIDAGSGKYKDEEESEDEDPTELFHRDIGIQTSPPPSPSLSPAPSPPTPLSTQTDHLTSLSTNLSSLLSSSDSEAQETADLNTNITILKEYLEGLAYTVPSFGYGGVGGYGSFGGGGGKEDDEIARVKAGIRGVKGVLLSARSFPGVKR